MAIIPVIAKSAKNGRAVETYAFMDPGSSVSFCTERLKGELGLGGRKARITLDTMGSTHIMNTHIISGLIVSNLQQETNIELPNVYSKDRMPVGKIHIPTQDDIDKWEHLRSRVTLPALANAEIGLMIGNAAADAYTPLEVATGPPGTPYAARTALGWIPWNIVRHGSSVTTESVNRVELQAIQKFESWNNMVRDAVNIDFPESTPDKPCMSVEDRQFVRLIDEKIKFGVDGHYTIPLPWRDDRTILPDNSVMAKKRYALLERRLARDTKLGEDYSAFMEKMFERGYAEEVVESTSPANRMWHLPHHPVYHARKPGKLRVVFDCAAKYGGVSLNDVLLQGPDLTNSLIGVLLKFREEKVALMADIEGMFLQVVVPEEDRDVLRFYWRKSPEEEVGTYRMTRHLFGATSSPACANKALLKTADDNTDKYSAKAVEIVRSCFYVDDCLTSVGDQKEAMTLFHELTSLCRDGGFRLTKWISNDKSVLSSIPPEERAPEFKNLDLSQENLPVGRALGVYWSAESDTLGFRVSPVEKNYTRRGLLSIISSVFDPLGLAAPFILPAKILLQELCRNGLGWDEYIDGVFLQRWQQWLSELTKLKEWKVQRCYKSDICSIITNRELHVFADASTQGYGMASYLRQEGDDGEVQVSLVLARSRVAPLKHTSIPRLELTAAVMAARLTSTVLDELENIREVVYWTDSQTVLKYIYNTTRRFKTFVANRVSVILAVSNPSQWKYVRTCNNPADEASRGLRIDDLLRNERWLNGPQFLRESPKRWLEMQEMANVRTIPADDPEVKGETNAAIVNQQTSVMENLVNRYSSFKRLKRIVAWLLVFKENLRRRIKGETDGTTIEHLGLNHLQDAEKLIVSYIQHKHFGTEITALRNGNVQEIAGVLKGSPLRKLDPVLRDEVLHVGGRLERSSLPDCAKHPVLVPKESPIAKLIIMEAHIDVGHLGRGAILAKLWERYWVIGAGSLIRSVLSKCVTCRKHRGRVVEQKMASLPCERVLSDQPPFDNTGLDMFGPFEIKQGRSLVKRYGLVFTCLATRAVHLEIVHTADTSSCLNAIRRFICRRGDITSLRTDNGTNFVGGERELKDAVNSWNSSEIPQWLHQRGIHWYFNPPAASHFGGVWERQIRTVRQVLKGVLKEQRIKMDDEGLRTLFCEVESIVNNRPITTVSTDPNDIRPLTPSMLLTQRHRCSMPPGLFNPKDVYARRRWRQVQYLADLFWGRWRKEYLPTLQKRQKWLEAKRNMRCGDVVLVVDNALTRNNWLLGRITETKIDKKGFVRSCFVKTQHATLERPIAKLCLLLESDQGDN